MLSRFYRAADGAKGIEAGKGASIPVVAATAGRKQDGIDLADLKWDFQRARSGEGGRYRYPLLYAHDMSGPTFGVADVGVGEDGTSLDDSYIIFDPEDEAAVKLERKFLSPVGGLDALSISWEPVDEDGMFARSTGNDPVANQLMEVSLVPVPMDFAAGSRDTARAELLARSAAKLRSLARDITDVLDDAECDTEDDTTEPPDEVVAEIHNEPADDDEGLERDVAAEMVAVFAQGTDDSDSARLRKYRALQPAYRRLGWTAPEFVERDELDALDDETWRALFLHDEPDLIRAGKVLSARNKADLTQAVKLIRSVLDTAGGMDGEDDDEDAERAVVEPEPEPEHQTSDVDAFARMLAELAQELPDND